MNKKIPFLDLRIGNADKRRALLKRIDAVFQHGRIILGPEVLEFENRVAEYCNRKFAVGVGSGTTALFLGLKGLGIGGGDEVITTSLSWIATANAIAMTGALPVFADIRDDLNIDPESVRKLISSKTKAIMPVHYMGKVCEMKPLIEMARKNKLLIVEDASQSFGATYYDEKAGTFGDMACFSLNPMKIFPACGDAGVVLTDDENVKENLLILRHNGMLNREICKFVSINGRIDTLQAAILLERFEEIEEMIQNRRERAKWYSERLGGVVKIPLEKDGERDVFCSYTIRAANRDGLRRYLEEKGIETSIQWPYLMPEQPPYKENSKSEFKNAGRLIKETLSIPVHEKLTIEDVDYVASCIKEFYKNENVAN